MRINIRYIQTRGLGQEVHASTFNGNVLTIGRGADQVIQIPDRRLPLAHSKISRTSGQLSISALHNQHCAVNDQVTRYAPLVVGDIVSLSGYTLKITEGEGGADYGIAVLLDHDLVEPLRERFVTRLAQRRVPVRRLAWLFFLLVIGLGLVGPVTGFFSASQVLQESPLTNDRIWSSGDLHPTHAFMADDCNYCHVKPFTQTSDKECLACHQSIEHHFHAEKMGRYDKVADACGDCHQEHNVTGSITRSDAGICVECHADLAAVGLPAKRLGDATDFSDNHPPFKLTLQRYGEDRQWHSSRVDMRQLGRGESSNLLFSHKVHLAEAGIKSAQGTVVLACADCHESEKAGLNMQTVTMESHCADCHQLTFDAATPDRVVPHGSPEALMSTLREYYAFQFLDRYRAGIMRPSQEELDLPQARPARRPGQPPRPRSISDLMLTRTLDGEHPVGEQARRYIEARVAEAAQNLFEKQICTQCHEVSRQQDEAVPWRVLPVRLSSDWMPLADFSHESHKNMQCQDCHEAGNSEHAVDVLMPAIGVCRNCHGGENTENRMPGSCVSCHSFHLASAGPWRDPSQSIDSGSRDERAVAAP